MNSAKLAKLPLRQRKFARTKLGLLRAAMDAVADRPLEDVPVKALCAAVSISEASFFNYFPRKPDLLTYFVRIWSLEMAWHARRLAEERGGLAAIEEIFALTARQIAERPNVMAEIVAHQARRAAPEAPGDVSRAERLTAFPDLEGIEAVEAGGLDTLVPPLLEQAVAAGALPPALDRTAALVAIAAVFFGVPVILRADPAAIEGTYSEQLAVLWAGLRARPEPRKEQQR